MKRAPRSLRALLPSNSRVAAVASFSISFLQEGLPPSGTRKPRSLFGTLAFRFPKSGRFFG